MRLSIKEINLIKNKIDTTFGDSLVYLFGSRVNDDKQGGDMDLYIMPNLKCV